MTVQTSPSLEFEDIGKRIKALALKRTGLAIGLWGQAGIGKTFSAQQLLQQSAIRSCSVYATMPFTLWLKDLPQPSKLPMWAEVLYGKASKGEALGPAQTLDLLGALLNSFAPFLLHLEDLHEAPPEQVNFMVELAQIVRRSKGVGLLVTSRGELPEPLETFRLEPLSPLASRELLQGHAGAELPNEALEWIFGKAAGNPLFTLEYFRHLARMGNLWNDGQHWHWRAPQGQSIPMTVEALIEQTLSQVMADPTLGKVLSSKALLSKGAAPEIVAALAEVGPEALAAAQHSLRQRGILVGDGFAHPLFGEVALRQTAAPRRAELARRAIASLQTDAPQQAVLLLDDAGLESAVALELLTRAARTPQPLRERGLLLARAAGYAEGAAQGQLALEAAQLLQGYHLDKALEVGRLALGHPETMQQAVWLVGPLLARSSDLEGLERLVQQYPSGLSQEELRLRAYQIAGQQAKVVEWWEAHPQLHSTTNPDLLYSTALAHLATGRLPAFRALLAQALALPLAPLVRLNFVGIEALSYLDVGEYGKVIAGCRAMIEGLRQAGDRHKLGGMLHNLSIAHKALLEYPQALQGLSESLEIRREMGDLRPYANSLGLIAEIEAEMGQQAQAEAHLEEALGILQMLPASPFYANTLSQASYVYGLPQTSLAALLQLKHATRALAVARELDNERLIHEVLYDYAMAQIRSAAPDKALQTIAEMRERAANSSDPVSHRWRAWQAEALALEALGQTDKAKAAFERAFELAESIPDLLNTQKLGLELDRLNRDAISARRRLEWFEARGLGAGAALALRFFPELAQSKPVSRAENTVRLEVLGSPNIDGTSLRGRKRQELLALLLEARLSGRAEVSRLTLLETLYPQDDELKASAALKQLVSSLRESLGEAAIQTAASGYTLGSVRSDAEDFLQSGDTALWRGAYLEGLSLESSVADSLYLSLKLQAEALLTTDPKEAARLGRILLEADPYSRDYLQLCLNAYKAADNYKTIGRLYNQARERMREVGEHLPPQWTEFVQQYN